ncbi:MAG TPA: alpha/beta fold hydrolase [bacterium]|nr:alpha/beta fold hydrolase [bacterium]
MSADRFVEVFGSRIRYRVEGSGPPIVLLHGVGASLEYWNWTTPALRERHTTIAFDYPGFGESEPRESAYSPSGAAETVLAFLDTVGIRAPVLVGSSLGGAIATLAAGTVPERISALVLVAPGGFGPAVNPLMRLQTIPLFGEALVALARLDPGLATRDLFTEQRRVHPQVLEIIKTNLARPVHNQTYLKVLRIAVGLGGVRQSMLAQVHRAAGRITAPTLILWGSRDRIVPHEQAEVASRLIRGSRVHTLKGVGHLPYVETPDEFNTALWAFLMPHTRQAEAHVGH